MPLSAGFMESIGLLAAECKARYAFAGPAKMIPWPIIIELLSNLIMSLCKPDTAKGREAIIKKWDNRLANGVKKCCPANVRKKVMVVAGVDDVTTQDRSFYTIISQCVANRKRTMGMLEAAAAI